MTQNRFSTKSGGDGKAAAVPPPPPSSKEWKVGDLVWVSDQVEAWVPASIASIDASLVRGTAQKSRHVPQRPSHLPESPSSSPNMRYSSLSKSTVSWAQQVYDEGQIVEVDLSTSFEKELSGRLLF